MISGSRCLCRPLVWLHGSVHQCTRESNLGKSTAELERFQCRAELASLVLREESLGIEKSGMMGGGSGGDNGATTRRRQPSAATPYQRATPCNPILEGNLPLPRGATCKQMGRADNGAGKPQNTQAQKAIGFEQTSNISNRLKATKHKMFFYIINKNRIQGAKILIETYYRRGNLYDWKSMVYAIKLFDNPWFHNHPK